MRFGVLDLHIINVGIKLSVQFFRGFGWLESASDAAAASSTTSSWWTTCTCTASLTRSKVLTSLVSGWSDAKSGTAFPQWWCCRLVHICHGDIHGTPIEWYTIVLFDCFDSVSSTLEDDIGSSQRTTRTIVVHRSSLQWSEIPEEFSDIRLRNSVVQIGDKQFSLILVE